MTTKTMTPEQALEWLEDLSNMTGDQVCAEIEAGKAAKAAQVFRVTLEAAREEVDALLDALRQITTWPDGGSKYGQENIKRFAREIIDTTLTKENHDD